jgi:hypothetical protein
MHETAANQLYSGIESSLFKQGAVILIKERFLKQKLCYAVIPS